MNEEIEKEDNINIYNANFEYNDNEEQILRIYNMNEKIENNDIIAKKIIKRIYYHPLFLNYNYCLFCLERRKTKYNEKNLYDKHKKSDINKVSRFIEREKIKLKFPENKYEKLAKRRFIHSCEHLEKQIMNNIKHSGSDTELLIEEKENIDLIKKSSTVFSKTKKSSKLLSKNLTLEKSFDSQNTNNQNYKKFNSNTIKRKNIKTSKTINQYLLRNKRTNSNQNLSEEKENPIFNRRKRHLKSTKKVDKTLSFFGFVLNQLNNSKNNESKDFFLEPTEEDQINNFQYFEKNEKCGICLEEIKDKFTLFCGDFFCRECIINLLEESINDIKLFNKLICPSCEEPISENTIKFLLNGKSLEKYNKQKMRIDGLKNPNNIPCPYPDCEGFANKENESNNTYKCQNGHVFCKDCLDIIVRPNKKYKHKCEVELKYPKTTKYLNSNSNIKKCPNCNCWVEREPGGCNYFKCANIWCNYEFCWICGGKYDPSHYKNPLSTCFRLSESEYQGKLIESFRIRRIRCILIMLLLILILFPIICIFFSIFSIFSFAMYFHFDGKELKSVRLRSKVAHKIVHLFYFAFISSISLALIPFGYMCLAVLIIAIPIIIIIKKVRKKRSDF